MANITASDTVKDSGVAPRRETHISRDELLLSDLHELFDDKIWLLQVKNYLPRLACDQLHSFLMENATDVYEHDYKKGEGYAYVHETEVYRFGLPLNSTFGDKSGRALETYLTSALAGIRALRQASMPYLSPADKLRVELDEIWSGRVNVATIDERKAFCGIGRLKLKSGRGPHGGRKHVDAVPTSYFPRIRKQFSANVYLCVPEEGGDLEVWLPGDTSPVSAKPSCGDMFIFNTGRPHGVVACGGPRSSIQIFIGLTVDGDILLWN